MPQKKTTTKKTTPGVAKKATAKKVVAKKAVKKTTKKVAPKAECVCSKKCTPAQAFWVNNGPVVKSLEDLVKALKGMQMMQYAYHTKRDGNDFAKWIHDCLGDKCMATRLKKARTRLVLFVFFQVPVLVAKASSGCTF